MKKQPIHLRITPPPPLPLGVWCMERACGHHQVVFLLFPLEEKLSFIADTNAPNLVLESLVYLLPIFEMSATIFNTETTYFLIIRVRTSGL